MTFQSLALVARCVENHFIDCCGDCAWFCGRRMVHFCSLCSIMSQLVTSSIKGIEVSPFTLALIGGILIYIQAASTPLGDGRVGVGTPSTECVST